MAEPLNVPYSIKHYLDFVSDGTGRVQIDEPEGFDATGFFTKQEDGRYGRDVSFAGGTDKLTLSFPPKGSKYGYYFEKLVQYRVERGHEGIVYYIINNNGADFIIGQVHFRTAETDLTTRFKCNVLQDVSEAKLKRRYDVKVDLFSDEDLDGNAITPVQTSSILLKAKPIVQNSSWQITDTYNELTGVTAGGTDTDYFNPAQVLINQGIENSLSWLDNSDTSGQYFVLVDAQEDLTDVEITIDLDLVYQKIAGDITSSSLQLTLFVAEEYDNFPYLATWFPVNETLNNGSSPVTIDETFTINSYAGNTLFIPRGYKLWCYFECSTASTGIGTTSTIINQMDIDITATSTAIDSVVSGIRLIDAMNQVTESINQDFEVDAPRYENGGEWYDNFIFDGNLIRGRDTEFVMTFKEMHEHIQAEFNSDYEVYGTSVFFGKYDDFYKNVDIGAFLQYPDDNFNMSFNERYAINRFNFKYNTYNQDKDDDNTIDAVHTEQEYLLPNLQVENSKDIKCEFIRDHFMLETTRKKAVDTGNTSSLSQDDKKFIVDVVPLAPNSLGGFTARMTHNVNSDGYLQLLNDGSFNWSLLGFGIGATFTINSTSNADDYTVIEFTGNIITLEAQNITPTSIGEVITEVEYAYTNVAYTIRTNENFDSITGVLNPNSYANLTYSIKRNILNNWGSYLKTATKYQPSDIRQTYFKNDVTLVTQYNGGDIITENTNITQAELTTALLTPNIIKTNVLCDFSTYFDLQANIKTYRGFARVYDNEGRVRKIFCQANDFKWKDGLLEITGEEKYESEYLTIENTEGYFVINEVGYDTDIVPTLVYYTDGDYIQIFDVNNRPLINKTRYDFVTVNGTAYDSIAELTAAIDAL